jgi:hypothetical protein
MSQWGKRDNIPLAGALTANLGSYTITADSTNFEEANVRKGDTIFIANVGYKIANIVSNTVITLDVPYEASNSTALVYYIQQSPKDLTTYGWGNVNTGANTVNARNVYGVDRTEITVTENKNRGIGHTGWVHYRTHGTSQGGTRNISEVLVAMSKNFNANAGGTLNLLDANDDTIVADYRLYFLTQPTNQSATAGNSVVFTTAAQSDPTGATLSYQWFVSTDNIAYIAVSNASGNSGATTNILTIANVSVVDGNYYKLTVSTTGGADSITSTVVQATEA